MRLTRDEILLVCALLSALLVGAVVRQCRPRGPAVPPAGQFAPADKPAGDGGSAVP